METTEEMKQRRFTWKLDKLQLRVSYSQWPQSRSPLPNFVFLILICLKEDPQNYVCSGLTNGFPGGAVVNNMPASAGDLRDTGSILGSGRSPGGRSGSPLQYSCLENPTDRGDWWAAVHGVSQSWTRLSDWAHMDPFIMCSWFLPNVFCKYSFHFPVLSLDPFLFL